MDVDETKCRRRMFLCARVCVFACVWAEEISILLNALRKWLIVHRGLTHGGIYGAMVELCGGDIHGFGFFKGMFNKEALY